ncbi:MAG TPA: septation protein SepH [Mycobacteriales bacterium]|nr:septation protein SepH [Mycobacteriales bacterium]
MRQLRVLGVSDDGASLLLGTSENGRATHQIPLDDRLRAAVRGQLAASGGDRVESALSPKEIQSRLRAGDSPEAIAKAAGVPVARVLPYAAPVEAERQRIVDEARAVPVSPPRGPKASRPLGVAVDARLSEVAGLKPDTVEWSARRRPDGAWIVSLSYAARGGKRSAAWLWHPAGRELTAEDLSASRLAADDTGTKRARPARRAERAPARRAPAASAPARKQATAKRAAKPATATATKTKTTGSKPTPKPKRAVTKAARTSSRPDVAQPKVAAAPVDEAPEAPTLDPSEGGGARRAGARVPVPSWSDVLLGVAPPRDDDATNGSRAPRRRRG